MGNTLRVRLMGNIEINWQHFFENLVCCPLVSPTVFVIVVVVAAKVSGVVVIDIVVVVVVLKRVVAINVFEE